MSEVAEEVGQYKGRTIYKSLRRHAEHVGGVMYRVDEGQYFAEVEREAIPYELPGTKNCVLMASADITQLESAIDSFEAREKGREKS
jgi:hypothetical protein